QYYAGWPWVSFSWRRRGLISRNLATSEEKMQVHGLPKSNAAGGPPDRPGCPFRDRRSDHRIPRNRDQPVFGAVLLDMANRGEGEVESHHGRLIGRGHVVELVTRSLRNIRVHVVSHMPVRITQEELGDIGDIGLDQNLGI